MTAGAGIMWTSMARPACAWGRARRAIGGGDLTRAVPAVVAHSALAGLRSATIDGREEGVRRRVTRAWNRVSRLLQRCSEGAARLASGALQQRRDSGGVRGGHRRSLQVAVRGGAVEHLAHTVVDQARPP